MHDSHRRIPACLLTLSNICSMVQPHIFLLHSSVMVCVCFLAQIRGQPFASAVSRLSLPVEQRSLEPRELRAGAGGSVGGTLPLRSARALVPGPAPEMKQELCWELTRQSLGLPCWGARDWRLPMSRLECILHWVTLCVPGPSWAGAALWSSNLQTCPAPRREAGTIFSNWATFTLRIQFCPKTYIGNGNKVWRSVRCNSEVHWVV